MAKLKLLPALLALLAAGPAAVAAPQYDFIICANVNKGYVIGSKIVTTNGLFRLDEAGVWRHFGYNDSTLTGAAFDPRDPSVYYTSALNGLWAPLEGSVTGRMVNSWDMTEGRDVAIDPNSPDDVYVAITDGVAVTRDGGRTIQRCDHGLPERGKYTETIEVDRTTAGRLFAGCEKGVYLTEDAAANWRQVVSTKAQVNDIQQSPHDPAVWMAVTDEDGAWISRDRGLSWTQVEGLPSEHALYNVAFDPTNPQRIAVGSWTYGVHTSEDGGATWGLRNAGLPENPSAWRVGVNPNNGRLYASIFRATLFYSDDFGRTWHPDVLEGSLVNRFFAVPRVNR
ncbi:MAG: VPS10 domain-containing protein [Cephaloticoccus sp.]